MSWPSSYSKGWLCLCDRIVPGASSLEALREGLQAWIALPSILNRMRFRLLYPAGFRHPASRTHLLREGRDETRLDVIEKRRIGKNKRIKYRIEKIGRRKVGWGKRGVFEEVVKYFGKGELMRLTSLP